MAASASAPRQGIPIEERRNDMPFCSSPVQTTVSTSGEVVRRDRGGFEKHARLGRQLPEADFLFRPHRNGCADDRTGRDLPEEARFSFPDVSSELTAGRNLGIDVEQKHCQGQHRANSDEDDLTPPDLTGGRNRR